MSAGGVRERESFQIRQLQEKFGMDAISIE
jgi:hypothetical protein